MLQRQDERLQESVSFLLIDAYCFQYFSFILWNIQQDADCENVLSTAYTEKYDVDVVIEHGADRPIAVLETWKANGVLHRTAGPALIERDPDTGIVTQEQWVCHGVVHREDGPAEIARDRESGHVTSERWFLSGRLHRDGQPASLWYDMFGNVIEARWYRHGTEVTADKASSGVGRPASPSGPRPA